MDKPVDDVDKSLRNLKGKSVLGIFAKQPVPGQVKTRLCPPLSHLEAAGLCQCTLQETIARMRGHREFDLVICFTGERGWFEANFPGVPLLQQRGEDLGARMSASISGLLAQGCRRVVLIGSDIPDLPVTLVEEAFLQLQRAEVVLVPADDGGYVLVGQTMNRPELFAAIPWSSAEVLPETLRRIEALGIEAVLLPGWEDLDDLDALQRFLTRSPQSQTAAYLRQHLARHFTTPERT